MEQKTRRLQLRGQRRACTGLPFSAPCEAPITPRHLGGRCQTGKRFQIGGVERARIWRQSDAMLTITSAAPKHRLDIAKIIMPVIRAGETYALDPAMSVEDALAYWLGADRQTFVALDKARVVGTYYIRSNQPGGGAHVANCGYMVDADAGGKGIARQMCLHSLDHARDAGFAAMQFNFVVSSNERAVRLWQSCGFAIVGRLPLAFNHPTLGLIDALVMHKML